MFIEKCSGAQGLIASQTKVAKPFDFITGKFPTSGRYRKHSIVKEIGSSGELGTAVIAARSWAQEGDAKRFRAATATMVSHKGTQDRKPFHHLSVGDHTMFESNIMSTRQWTMALAVAVLAGMTLSAEAAEIKRVKCRVDDDPTKVQIAVNVRDVDVDPIDITVSNSVGATATILDQFADAEGDVQVEWDSDPDADDPAEGTRALIDSDFAAAGETVTASATGAAPRSVDCREK
jgi:hypothetical protein